MNVFDDFEYDINDLVIENENLVKHINTLKDICNQIENSREERENLKYPENVDKCSYEMKENDDYFEEIQELKAKARDVEILYRKELERLYNIKRKHIKVESFILSYFRD